MFTGWHEIILKITYTHQTLGRTKQKSLLYEKCLLKGSTDGPHHISSGKFKVKNQWIIATHLLDQPKSWTPTIPNADEDVKWQGLSDLAGRKSYRKSVCGFLQTKHTLIRQSAVMLLHIYPEVLESPAHWCLWQLYSQLPKATKMSFSR